MARLHRLAVKQKRHICAALAGYVAMVLSMAAPGSAQDKNQQRLKISLQPVRWQTLPAEIRSVRFGPDGRGWLGLAPGEAKDADIRASLEREYSEESPQLRGASLALLEPDGRAWFYVKP